MALLEFGDGVRLERGVRCRLSDGTVLVSDHYYPAGDGPWPTLFMRQPYGRDIASTVVYAHPAWFAQHGYHVAIQDVRGRGGSEGEFYPFRHEGRDGAESIAWLRNLSACNGKIGMYGFSYQGATQLLAAAEQPEGLLCIAPHMTAADLYQGWFYHHGALRLSATLGWGIQMLREDARRRGLREASDGLEAAWVNLRAQAQFAPYGKHPAIAEPELPEYVRDWMSHREAGDYWAEMDISTRLEKIVVPALHIAGWFDLYLEGSVAGYEALRKHAGSEHAREHQYLLAGPWVHIPWGDRAGEAGLGEAANLDTDEVLLRWFNHWLKDSGEFSSEAPVRYFALGPDVWRNANEWPAMDMRIHAGETERFQRRLHQATGRATCLFMIRRFLSSRRAARRRRVVPSTRRRWNWATMFSSTHRRGRFARWKYWDARGSGCLRRRRRRMPISPPSWCA
jgi:hypothetical protein